MAVRASVLVLAAAAGASGAIYSLDPAWPKPFAYNVSRITAAAVVTTASKATEIHVAQRGLDAPPVLVFDVDGNLTRSWGERNITSIHGLSSQHVSGQPDTLWVADAGDFMVKQFSLDGSVLRGVGTPGRGGGGLAPVQFSSPADVSFTAAGSIAVSDGDGGSNNRVLMLAGGDLSVEYGVGSNGTGPGQFESPHSIDVDNAAGQFWVANRGDGRLDAFQLEDGLWLGSWGQECFPGFQPWGVRVDRARNHLLVSDGLNNALYIVNLTTTPAAGRRGAAAALAPCAPLLQNISISASVCHTPHELGLDAPTGDVYVACVGAPTGIQRYVLKG